MAEIHYRNIIIHTESSISNPVDAFGAKRTLVIWSHGCFDTYTNTAVVPEFTTLHYLADEGTVSILPQAETFIRGKIHEASLPIFASVNGGQSGVNYILLGGDTENIGDAAMYDYVTVPRNEKARLSDVWDALNNNRFLRYAKVLGWFCRVHEDHKFSMKEDRDEDGRMRRQKGKTLNWDLIGNNNNQ